jgi:hypothetical protein
VVDVAEARAKRARGARRSLKSMEDGWDGWPGCWFMGDEWEGLFTGVIGREPGGAGEIVTGSVEWRESKKRGLEEIKQMFSKDVFKRCE